MIIETKIEVIDSIQEELMGVESIMHINLAFNIADVSAVREVIDDDEYDVNTEKCQVYLRNGQYFTIYTPYKVILEQLKQK